MTKYMYNGIKIDGELYKGWWSKGPWTKESKLPDGTITFYADGYKSIPLPGVVNESDMMTDYFEKDRIRFTPGHPNYAAALEAHGKQEMHRAAGCIKRQAIRTQALEDYQARHSA